MPTTPPRPIARPLSLWERVRVRVLPSAQRTRAARLPVKSKLPACTRRATTLIECVSATLIVGVLLVAALSSAGGSLRMTQGIDDRARAQRLAGDLLNEIFLKSYQEPDGAVG